MRWRRCCEKAGFRVTREYYVNDAGGQVDALARSLRLRYLIAAGAEPADAFERAAGRRRAVQYGGDYLVPVAEEHAGPRRRPLARCAGSGVAAAFRGFAVERDDGA